MKIEEIKNMIFYTYQIDGRGTKKLYIWNLNEKVSYVTTASTRVLRLIEYIDSYEKQIIGELKKEALLNLIENCDILNWDDKYENVSNNIYGGCGWFLIIETVDGKKIEKRGKNKAPETLKAFQKGLLKIFEEEYKYYNEGIIEFLEKNEDESVKRLAGEIYEKGLGIKSVNLDKAKEVYANNLEDTESMKRLANIYLKESKDEQDIDKALELFLQAENRVKNDEFLRDYDVYYKIGCIYYYKEEFEKAIEQLKIAIPEVEDAYKRLIEIYYILKDYNEIYEYFVDMSNHPCKEELCNLLKGCHKDVIKNLKKMKDKEANFEAIETNIIKTVINDNIEIIYKKLLIFLIYNIIASEPDESCNIQIYNKYIDNTANLWDYEKVYGKFKPNTDVRRIYYELSSFISDDEISSLFKEVGLLIDKYLKKEKNGSLCYIASEEDVEEYAEKILKKSNFSIFKRRLKIK